MSATASISTGRSYGVARVCRVWELARSSYYAWDQRMCCAQPAPPAQKRGPKTAHSDAELLEAIRRLLDRLEQAGLRGEGYRKIHARLRFEGYRVGRNRVLRLMREHGLLAPVRSRRPQGPKVHDGTIRTERPDEMWGTDATRTWTREDGNVWVFVSIDHCAGDCVGIHAAKKGTRFAALEPVRQGIEAHFGEPDQAVAAGLQLRHDCGSQYLSEVFQDEVDFWGIESSPTFVYSPESNGIAERFIRTLKEQLLWVRTFDTVDELELALQDFRRRFNRSWIYERHGYKTPDQVRRCFDEHDGLQEAA